MSREDSYSNTRPPSGEGIVDDGRLAVLIGEAEEYAASYWEELAVLEAARSDCDERNDWAKRQMVDSIADARQREYYAAEMEQRESSFIEEQEKYCEDMLTALKEKVDALAEGGMPQKRWVRSGEYCYYMMRDTEGRNTLYMLPACVLASSENGKPEIVSEGVEADLKHISDLSYALGGWAKCGAVAFPLYPVVILHEPLGTLTNALMPFILPVLILPYLLVALANLGIVIGLPIWLWETGIGEIWRALRLQRRGRGPKRLREAQNLLDNPLKGTAVSKISEGEHS